MPHPQAMYMLRLLAAASWSDGDLADDEAQMLGRLIESISLDDDERTTAKGWLESAVDIEAVDVSSLSDNQRLATYQAAVRIALTDQNLDDAERAFLDRVRDALQIDPEQAEEIEAAMPRHD